MSISQDQNDGWDHLLQKAELAVSQFPADSLDRCSDKVRSDWHRLLNGFTRQSGLTIQQAVAQWSLTRDMVTSLPPQHRSKWEDIWHQYSLLRDGTPMSLLAGIQNGSNDAWCRFQTVYTPFLLQQFAHWQHVGKLKGFAPEDLCQELYARLMGNSKLQDFDRQQVGSFRNWLRKFVRFVLLETGRKESLHCAESLGEQLLDDASDLSQRWDREHQQHVLACALAELRKQHSQKHYDIFVAMHLNEDRRPVEELAKQFGETAANVYKLSSRMRSKLIQYARTIDG